MIITRTPYRITFFGSSTDHKNWWEKHGGISINASINQYSYILLKNLPSFFDYKSKLSYSEIEYVKDHKDIKHNIIRECLLSEDVHDAIDCSHFADLFSKCGLGSSSSFAVCLLHAISAHKREFLSKWDLAKKTINLEQNILRESVGYQDTLAAVFGGLNRFDYHRHGDITVTPIFLSSNFMEYLQRCSLLFFTGTNRVSHDISKTYVPSLLEKNAEQQRMYDIALDGYDAFIGEDFYKITQLLNKTWIEKRKISQNISTLEVDRCFDSVKNLGGFKLLGSGGGGTILVISDPKNHPEIRERLNLLEIPFRIEFNGSKILYINSQWVS